MLYQLAEFAAEHPIPLTDLFARIRTLEHARHEPRDAVIGYPFLLTVRMSGIVFILTIRRS
jgi:hypothetical protein